MKNKFKSFISLLFVFTLLTGYLTPLMSVQNEPIEVKAETTSTNIPAEFHKNCPKGNTQWEHTGIAVCWACSKDGCMDCGATGVNGRMYYGDAMSDGIHGTQGDPDIAENFLFYVGEYHNQTVEEKVDPYGIHDGNYHRGYGYLTNQTPPKEDGSYTIEYYACWNCVAKVTSGNQYAPENLLYTEYYDKFGELDIGYGNGTGRVDSPYYGKTITSRHGQMVVFEEGPGITPTYWCPQCGPELYDLYKAADPNYSYKDAKYITSIDDILDYTPYSIGNLITESSGSQFHLPKKYTVKLIAEPSLGGEVSLNGESYSDAVSEEYYKGSKVTAYAKAMEGYEFLGWYESKTSGIPKYGKELTEIAFTATKDYTLYAKFEKKVEKTYELYISAGNGGSVNNDINGKYKAGEVVTVKAKADPDYSFGNWTGHSIGNEKGAEFEFEMPAEDVSLKANFLSPTPTPTPVPKEEKYRLSVSISGDCEGCSVNDEVNGEYAKQPKVFDHFQNFQGQL